MLLVWDEDGWEDYLWWQAQDRRVLKRINVLIADIQRNGNEGIGKQEALKHDFAGYWSRRITDEHRLVYKVVDEEVRIAACRYHSYGVSGCQGACRDVPLELVVPERFPGEGLKLYGAGGRRFPGSGRRSTRGRDSYARVGYLHDRVFVGNKPPSKLERHLLMSWEASEWLVVVSRIVPRAALAGSFSHRARSVTPRPPAETAWRGVGGCQSGMVARLQHQPASSRAMATAITGDSFLRACRPIHRRRSRRSAASPRARTAGDSAARRAATALPAGRSRRCWCQAASTSSRRAWVLPVLVIDP